MKLIVGLGNPGKEYENTRHNAGFMVVEKIRFDLNFPDWQSSNRFKAFVSEGQIAEEKIILVQPQTFMNLSGQSVFLLANFYKIGPEDIWVIHDDLDLELGRMKISFGEHSGGGHKGIESIIDSLGSKKFPRFRIGISTSEKEIGTLDSSAFVLQKFNKDEKKIINEVIAKVKDSVILAAEKGLEAAMNKYNSL